MEPYSIACTTCKARLKVRDQSVVGQILACPKCGSMVLVTSPNGPAASPANANPTRPAHDSPPFSPPQTNHSPLPAAPRSTTNPRPPSSDTMPGDYGDLESLFADQPRDSTSAADASPKQVRSSLPALNPKLVNDMQDTAPEIESPLSDDVGETTSDSPTSAATPSASDTTLKAILDWTPPAVHQMRQLILIAAGGVVGVILAVATVSMLVSSLARKPKPTPTDTTATADPTTSEKKVATNATISNNTNTGNNRATPTPHPPTPSPAEILPRPSNPPPKSPVEPPPAPVLPQPAPMPMPVEPQPANPVGPPNLDHQPQPTPVPTSDVANPFARLFNPTVPASNEPTTPATRPLQPPASSADLPADRMVPQRPAPREVKVETQLAFKVPSFEFAGTLGDFVQLMATSSHVPITLDPDALMLRQLTLDTPVEIKARETSLGKLLADGLKSTPLVPIITDGNVLLTLPLAGELKSRVHQLDDLTGADAEQLETVSNWIKQLIAADTWTDETRTITIEPNGLRIHHTDAVHLQVIWLCEKLRAARGRPTRYAADLLKPNSLSNRAQATLDTKIRVTFSRATLFQQVIDRLGKASNSRFVIDWKSLGEAGWNPDTKVMLVADDQPLRDVLARLLEPMDLTVRVVTNNLLQVSTSSAVAQRLDLETFSLGSLPVDDVPQIVSRLKTAIGTEHFRDFGGAGGIVFDPASRTLLVALSQSQQREVVRLLNEWQAKP